MNTKLSLYDYNIMFSNIHNTSLKNFDLIEYKSNKQGTYNKVLKKYYDTYNSNGDIDLQDKNGLLFDVYI